MGFPLVHVSAIVLLAVSLRSSSVVGSDGPTTAVSTSEPPEPPFDGNEVFVVEYKDLTQSMKDGIVTVEFRTSNDTVVGSLDPIARRLRQSVVRILNAESATAEKNESTAASRRRRTGGERYREGEGGVEFVSVDPPIKDDTIRMSLFAESVGGDVLAAETLKNELNENKDQLSADTGMPVKSIYVGLPADVRPPVIPHDDRPTIWDRHFWMFMGVIILLVVALLVLLLCCICFRCCRGRKRSGSGDEPLQKKHAPVEEMVELAPVAPLQSAPPPMRQTPSDPLAGYEPPASTDDENGWIIPIDQLTPEELEQPDVQISRL